jgi:transaldolase
MENIKNLRVKIFADGADKASMLEMNSRPYILGLTTNPTLMKKAGIKNYKDFCLDILSTIKEKPLSFEVFSDDFIEMERQANEIASWGENVYVKIPITNTKGELSTQLVKNLTRKSIKVNVTALMTLEQVAKTLDALDVNTPSYVSVFAGRIADTGIDPVPIMAKAVQILKSNEKAELIWASPRELINVFQANEIGCQVITATSDIINKLKMVGYDLNEYSLDTVKMFYEDAKLAGYSI